MNPSASDISPQYKRIPSTVLVLVSERLVALAPRYAVGVHSVGCTGRGSVGDCVKCWWWSRGTMGLISAADADS